MNLIEYINSTPMELLKFRDFKNLKVGSKDAYSKLGYDALIVKVPVAELKEIQEHLSGDVKAIEQCIRWILRGLNYNKAIRKVKTDLEITMNYLNSPKIQKKINYHEIT